jgi:hypothetical protein
MAPRTKFYKAHREIAHFFDKMGLRVFTKQDLSNVLSSKAAEWNLPIKYNNKTFRQDLVSFLDFKSLIIGRCEVFAYKKPEYLDVFQKLKKSSFFSHYTALRLHGLTEQTPYQVFVSTARKNTLSEDTISQEAIDKAFEKIKGKTSETIVFDKYKIFDLDIETLQINSEDYSFFVKLTNIEKTLIDAAINPEYCGGPAEVLKAFIRAKDKVSVVKIKSILKRIGYKYPYHQLIGFYMERAEFDDKKIKIIEDIPMNNNFYLNHGKNDMYSPRWKLHYPNAL